MAATFPAVAGKSDQTTQKQTDRPPVTLLKDWNYDAIYRDGWSAKTLMDSEVFGPDGDDDIGEVQNVIVSDKGSILGIVAEVGGFLDMGDTHVFIPWDQVTFSRGFERVTIPVTQENVEDYAYKDALLMKAETGKRMPVVESDLMVGPRAWKASELLDDRAFLNGNLGYGWVSDLIFTTDGKLHAVVVNADAPYRGGYYAFPYYGYRYGWNPGSPHYNIGYGKDDIVNLSTKFDLKKMNDQVAKDKDSAAADTGKGKATN